MKDDYRYEIIDPLIDTYVTRMVKTYYQILELMDSIDEYKRRAQEYPAELSFDRATQIQAFLEDVGTVLQEYEPLFNELDE